MLITSTFPPHKLDNFSRPLSPLEHYLVCQHDAIEPWFHQQWSQTPPPFYASVDLRNAYFKLAPVDTNLFPAGFNNLGPASISVALEAMKMTLKQWGPHCKKILLIPENHTRNLAYLKNLAALSSIITQAGFTLRLGSLLETVANKKELFNLGLTLEPIKRLGDQIGIPGFWPDLILLNNDLSGGVPPLLQGIHQLIVPALVLGWHRRLKSQHFSHYDEVCKEFSKAFPTLDPWLINPLFSYCQGISFKERLGEKQISSACHSLLAAIREKYQTYQIQEKPFVIIKADSGTYGMGVLSLDDPEAIYRLNRKQRNSMNITKNKREISQVLIQEGVPTCEKKGNAVAEPVVYTIGPHVIGGFYRLHEKRGPYDNLNTPGMHFEPWPTTIPSYLQDGDIQAKRFYAYSVVARLALLAAAREHRTYSSSISP